MPSQEDINHQLKLLEIHRRNLRHYTSQQAHFGALTPAMVINSIREARENIYRIKTILQKWGTPFEDLDIDVESPASSPTRTGRDGDE